MHLDAQVALLALRFLTVITFTAMSAATGLAVGARAFKHEELAAQLARGVSKVTWALRMGDAPRFRS
jgi:hypothetical protein